MLATKPTSSKTAPPPKLNERMQRELAAHDQWVAECERARLKQSTQKRQPVKKPK